MSTLFDKLRQYGVVRTLQFACSEVVHQWYYQRFFESYSQNQEDLLLDKLLNYKKRGLYVDVGAYDPYRFSNTMRFYRRGWRGMNIEPNRQYWQRFLSVRDGDINLNAGVGEKRGALTFYAMDPPTLSTFQKEQVAAYRKQGFRLAETVAVPVYTLKEIFRKHLGNKTIDFMSIDVEGMEMQVLRSNDWEAYRPRYLCIESVDFPKTKNNGRTNGNIEAFLQTVKYKKVYDNNLNSFYKDIRE